MRLDGRLFEREARMERAIGEMEAMFRMVRERVAGIPEGRRKKVLYIGSKPTVVSGAAGVTNDMITLIGARNPASVIQAAEHRRPPRADHRVEPRCDNHMGQRPLHALRPDKRPQMETHPGSEKGAGLQGARMEHLVAPPRAIRPLDGGKDLPRAFQGCGYGQSDSEIFT